MMNELITYASLEPCDVQATLIRMPKKRKEKKLKEKFFDEFGHTPGISNENL